MSKPVLPKLTDYWSLVAVGAFTSVVTFAITVVFARWDGLQLSDLGAAVGPRSLPRLAGGFLIGLILSGLHSLSLGLVVPMRWTRASGVGFSAAGVVLLGYFLLACREELAFRGYPLRRLDWFLGPIAAQFLVSAVFAVEHVAGGYSWTTALLGPTVGSVLFGIAALSTRGLAVPIGIHAAWNFGQWAAGGKEFPGPLQPIIQPELREYAERAGMIAYLVLMMLTILAFGWLYKKRRLQ